MRVTQSAFFDMVNYIGANSAEKGGFFFGYEHDHVLRRFIPDRNAATTGSSYAIDADGMNPIIKELWKNEELQTKGIIHSHPKGSTRLSSADLIYFNDLRTYVKRKYWFAPLVQTIQDGGLKVFPYVFVEGSDQPHPTKLEVVADDFCEPIAISKKEAKESVVKPATSNEFVFILNQTTPTQPRERNKVIEISLVILAAAAVFSLVYFGTLYGLPKIINFILNLFGS